MRFIVLGVATAMLLIVGCGKKNNTPAATTPWASCSQTGTYNVTFNGTNAAPQDTLVLGGNCTAMLQNCEAAFTYQPTANATGQISVNVSQSSQLNGCPSLGAANWQFGSNGSNLTLTVQ